MNNMRRHFRYDVKVPIYFEAVDAQGNFHKTTRQDILPVKTEERLLEIEEDIQLVQVMLFILRKYQRGLRLKSSLNF